MLKPMDARKLAQRCRELAEDKKAENVVVLDLRELSSVTDYFVVASGTSEPHLRAIVDEIAERIREEYHLKPSGTEGSWQTNWVVLDYFDVIVHVMRPETREHYGLEQLWGDAGRVRVARKRAASAGAGRAKSAVTSGRRKRLE
ncbi:MAG: ribosome silencing factor [Verrucomicrobiae bacterium]|nr:ribosome silencing factor [Verrucomicrobiae bacterium]MCP5521232.1 ribosome silencing factor [Verrucomicrobiales bacterium]